MCERPAALQNNFKLINTMLFHIYLEIPYWIMAIYNNNNNLATWARANFAPYGSDFPDGVTGRFSNGRTMADVVGLSPLFLNSYIIRW